MSKMASVKIVPNQDLDSNCRLRNGLNSNCLIEIFKFLDLGDLVKLADMNDYYKQLINDFIIGQRIIITLGNCTRWNSQLFKNFGRKMKHIKFSGDEWRFKHFVMEISKYCTGNEIKTIDISFTWSDSNRLDCNCPKTITELWAEAAREYLRNVEKVSIRCAKEPVCEIIETMFSESKNIRILKLKQCCFLSWNSTQLIELHLINSNVTNKKLLEDWLVEYICSQSKLEQFISHGGYYSIRRVGEALAVNCSSKLQVFCDYENGNRNRTVTDYDFISKFANLKEVKLTSFTKSGNDLYRPLMKLANKPSIEKLGIYQNADYLRNEFDTFKSISELKNLKFLEIIVVNFQQRNEPTHLNYLFRNDGIIFKNVETLILSGQKGFVSASKIVGMVPNVKKLQINKLDQWQWLIETRRILCNIDMIVKRRNIKNDEVTIVVDPRQWCDFAIFKGDFIKLIIIKEYPMCMIPTLHFKMLKSVEIPNINRLF